MNGTKAVSFLPSRPVAKLIDGGGQLPKSAPEVAALETVFAAAEALFAAVEDKEVWRNGQEKGATTAYETDLFSRTGLVGGWGRTDRDPESNIRQGEHRQCHKRDNSRSTAVPHRE